MTEIFPSSDASTFGAAGAVSSVFSSFPVIEGSPSAGGFIGGVVLLSGLFDVDFPGSLLSLGGVTEIFPSSDASTFGVSGAVSSAFLSFPVIEGSPSAGGFVPGSSFFSIQILSPALISKLLED